MNTVYGYQYGAGFGDFWIFANNLAYLSEECSEVLFNPTPKMTQFSRSQVPCYTKLIFDILNQLDYKQSGKIIPVTDTPTQYHFRYRNIYCPTKIKFKKVFTKNIVYQEDARCVKPTQGQLDIFFETLKKYKDFNFIRLGLPRTIEENINIASRAKAFIGFQSGMTHLCLSVGVPVYLTDLPDIFFPEKYGINQCTTIQEMIETALFDKIL